MGITATINDSGMPTVRGGRWRLGSVQQMILSPRVAGIMPYRGKVGTLAAADDDHGDEVHRVRFLHLEQNRPAEDDPQPEAEPEHPDADRLADVRKRLSMMRNGMREGTVSPESFFAVVPGLEAQEKKLIAGLGKARRAQADRVARLRTPEEVRADWENTTIPGRRELLGQYLQAVIVHPAQAKGRGVFDHTTIEPVWKPLPQ